jgi:hypothetical protein
MASRRSKSTKSVGNLINDARNKVQQIQTSSVSGSSGVAEGGINAAAMGVNAVTTDIIAPGSITADKLAAGINSPGGQSLQRVPSPVVDVKYWTEVVAERVSVHTEAYFLNKEAKNVSATISGILFSPEKSANLSVTYRELEPTGATITTNVASGYDVGDTITVLGVGSPFDGTWTVLAVDEDSNALSYLVQEGTQQRIAVSSDKYLTASITGLSKSSNVVTFTANNSFREDQLVSITGVSPSAYNFTGAHVRTANATHFAVYDEISTGSYVSGGTAVAIPTAKSDDNAFAIGYYETADSTGIVSITTVVDHGFEVGDLVEVGGLGSPYDGTFVITESNADIPKEFKYDTTVGLVEPEAVTGGYVSVQADAAIFLTGKHPVPVSKKVSINWISSESLDIYGVYWNLVNDAAVPIMVKIQTGSTGVTAKVGANAYEWDIPSDASHYAIYAEVLADSAERYLQEISVFELVGDKNQKSSRIATVDIKDHVITIATAEPHSFVVGDEIIFDKMDYVSNRLNGVKLPIASITNASTFVVNSTSSTDDTVNALNLSDTYDVVDMTNTLALVFGGTQKATTTISPTEVIVTDRLGATLSSITDTATNELTVRNTDGQVVAGIKKDGSAVFTNVDADYYTLDGRDIFGNFRTAKFDGKSYDSVYNLHADNDELYTTTGDNSYLNRLARGVVYEAVWDPAVSLVLNTTTRFSTLASGYFKLEPNRSYQIIYSVGGMFVNNSSNLVSFLDLNMGLGPLSLDGSRILHNRSAIGTGTYGSFVTPPLQFNTRDDRYTQTFNISQVRKISNTSMMVTTSTSHALTVGSVMGVVDAGWPFSGYWEITAVTSNTLTYTIQTGVYTGGAVANTAAPAGSKVVFHSLWGDSLYKTLEVPHEAPASQKIFWSLVVGKNASTADVSLTYTTQSSTANSANAFLQVIDLGQAKGGYSVWAEDRRTTLGSQSAEFDSGQSGQEITETITTTAVESAYYDNYGRGTGTTDPYAYRYSLYQGNPGTASGTKKSALRFTPMSLPAGAVVNNVQLYLRNRHTYNSNGLTCYIGAHIDSNLSNQTTPPAGYNFTGATDTMTTAFTRGQGKWITLPAAWYDDIGSGTITGFLVGLSAITNTWYGSLANYGFFDGYSMADPPKLRVTYTYLTGVGTGTTGGSGGVWIFE